MARFSTCVGCALSPKTCFTGWRLHEALEGMFVSYVRHRCAERVPLYQPGAAVLIRTRAWQTWKGEEREGEPPICDFRGTFVRQVGLKAICFIAPKSTDTSGAFEFEPSNTGFVKIPMSRVQPLPDVPPVDLKECGRCGHYYGLDRVCDSNVWDRRHPCIAEAANG